ncbi:MAG: radical SAM protein [Thermodesulfobacteriota bacterium]
MKILLIQPPLQDFYQTSIRTQPIGLAYLASSLRVHGHEVEILDCQTAKKRSVPVPPELSYLKEFYPLNDRSPFKLYSGYYHFGMDWGEIKGKIEGSKADIFGISSNFTPYHGESLAIARMIKEWDGQKIVVMGGAHVSCDPAGVLKSPWVDYAVLGEGEIRFPLLLEQIEKGGATEIGKVDGMGYRVNGERRIDPLHSFIQDLDALPHPARELLDLDRYQVRKKRSTMIITSRGCPQGCAYCSSHLSMGSSFRPRSPEAIIREMMECRHRYGIQIFDIEDDNFTFDQKRAKKLMGLIIQTFGEKVPELTAMNGVSFASLDEELLGLMKRAGFHTINLSFVTTDLEMKEKMRRPGLAVNFKEILNQAERVRLKVIAYAIFGMPGQTIEEMVDTLIYLMGERVLIGPSIYYPTPGTALFDRCRREEILPPHLSQWRSSALPIETKEFNRLDLITLFRLARTVNFIKGKMDKKELSEGVTWKDLSQIMKDKAKPKAENEMKLSSPLNKNGTVTWMDLLLLLLEERAFFGLRKSPGEEASLLKEETSQRVVDYFFEKAWRHPILKSGHG